MRVLQPRRLLLAQERTLIELVLKVLIVLSRQSEQGRGRMVDRGKTDEATRHVEGDYDVCGGCARAKMMMMRAIWVGV